MDGHQHVADTATGAPPRTRTYATPAPETGTCARCARQICRVTVLPTDSSRSILRQQLVPVSLRDPVHDFVFARHGSGVDHEESRAYCARNGVDITAHDGWLNYVSSDG